MELPIIYCIHASDAPQHAGELKAILSRMKAENIIFDFRALDIAKNPGISFTGEDTQGIIVLLTHETEQIRPEIEKLLPLKHDIKLIEIVVDNLPYNNSFISFPQDLKPIRSRDDMNLVWKNIEQDLIEMFHKPGIAVTQPPATTDYKKYLKLAGISIIALVLCNMLMLGFFPHIADNSHIALNIFITLLPFIIFAIHKKSLEPVTLPLQGSKQINGAVDWKQLIKRTSVSLVVLFVSFYLWALTLILTGILPGPDPAPAILGVLTTLLFIVYRAKSEKKTLSAGQVKQNS